jgi:ethanolamine transporter
MNLQGHFLANLPVLRYNESVIIKYALRTGFFLLPAHRGGDSMLFKQILMSIICIFFVLGAVDYFIGGRLGLSGDFLLSFSLIGRIALAVAGIICLSPVISDLLTPVIVPLFGVFGIDPAMFAPIILAPDSGGYSIAMEMAADPAIGAWAGTVVAAHIGCAFSFNLPNCLGTIPKSTYNYFSLGSLLGLATCPVGCIVGGLLAGLPLGAILKSLIPAILVAVAVILGLIFFPNKCIRMFVFLGRCLTAVAIFGLILGTFQQLTGIIVIDRLKPVTEGLQICGIVGLTMAGVLCMTNLFSRTCTGLLRWLSRTFRVDQNSILFSIIGLVTVTPGAAKFDTMTPKGRVLFSAMVMSCANILGAHFSFVGVYVPDMLIPTVVGKFSSGAVAILVIFLFAEKLISVFNDEPSPQETPEAKESVASI